MSFQDVPKASVKRGLLSPLSRRRNREKRRVFFRSSYIGLVCVGFLLFCDIIGSPSVYAASTAAQVLLKGSPSKPNTINPKTGATSQTRSPQLVAHGPTTVQTPQPIKRNLPLPMKAGSLALLSTQTAHFLGSDGRLDLTVPAGAISAQDLAQAGGKITLHITQVAPASGSNAGGSGTISLGTYLVQMLDAQGKLLTHGLRKPLTANYHFQQKEVALHLDHAHLVLNGTLPAGAEQVRGVVQPGTGSLANTMGPQQVQAVHLNMGAHLLSATPTISTPSTSLSWNSDSPIATFGSPDPSSVSLSAGALNYSLPITTPAGPGGLTPSIKLNYSSEAVNEQHNVSAATGWVGEGWSLSLGSISWSEHNVTAYCPGGGCGATWENEWYLSNADGSGSELIPPNINVSTYYDDTPNNYCGMNISPTYPCPILWHTATESHQKIYAYIGPLNIGQKIVPPCFRVWQPDGEMVEYGCTLDSLQYYYEPSVNGDIALVTGWYPDLITDPQGNQIHVTYQQDIAPWKSPVTGTTYNYARDVVLSTISYDSPSCHNAQTMCTGSSWAPQMQVVFNAGHSPSMLSGSVPTGCNTGGNLRCDDALDLSGSGGASAPLIQSTYALNSVQMQVRSSGTASWNTLNTYKLNYEQSGPTTITDPASGLSRSAAGMFDLTQVQQVGSTGADALLYSGMDNSASSSFAYMKVFDLSSKNITIGPNTTLSYWIFPQSQTTSSSSSGNNGTCVAIDMVFSDGSDLRDSGAVDQNGNQLHPAHQCGHLIQDQWNHVTSNIGAAVNGKTINRINVGYDQPANTGGYRGYIDDISLTNATSNTPLFATDFESGSPQPTWTNTVDTGNGGITNVGGVCCGLTGPELFVGQEIAHQDSAALPPVRFSYTTQTNTYEDDQYHPNPSNNCGPSWNTGNGSGCILWSQGYANNDRFMSSISNGQGLGQNFSWTIAHDNSHGVPGGGTNNANPFYCNSNLNGYPCNEADDLGWSHIVLTQDTATTIRLTQNGQVGAQNLTPSFHGTNDGNWNNVQSMGVPVSLNAGNNSILFSNPSGWAPDFDRIVVNGTSYEAESSANTVGGGAVIAGCSACSGGQKVGFVGNGGTLQFNGVNVSNAGTYTVTIYYANADVDRSAQMTVNGTLTPVTSTTSYSYQLAYPLPAQMCSDCVAGMYWGNQNDGDYLSYYNGIFTGFAQATVNLPSGAVEVHTYYAGQGWGLYDTSQIHCYATTPCHNDPWWNLANVAHGQETSASYYDTNGTTLLKQVNTTYQATCPPSGVSGTPASSAYGNWNGKLVAEFDFNNPVASCDVQPTQQVTQTFDGASQSVNTTVNWAYDAYGRVTQQKTMANGGTPTQVVANTSYVWNDTVTATQNSASGTYIIDAKAFTDVEDGSGNRLRCSYLSYDGQSYATGQSSTLTGGLATEQDAYTSCGTAANNYTLTGKTTTITTYDAYGDAIASDDPDANAGIAGHVGCSIGSTQHTGCTTYDSTFNVFPVSSSNALNQTSSISYASTGALNGYGLWPTSSTDANSQTTSYNYDSLGRMAGITLPGESAGNQTSQWVYTNWCSGTSSQAPCEEIDEIDSIDSTTTTTKRAFYDGEGRIVETRTPGPNNQDVIAYAYYDTSGRQVFKSNAYFVAAYTGTPGAAAYSIPDSTQPGTSTAYPTLLQTSVTDPNSHTVTTTYSVACGVAGTGDTGCYVQTTGVDANGHETASFTGGLGKVSYTQQYSGNSAGTYVLYATTTSQYDTVGQLISTQAPDGKTTASATYNDLGQVISQQDPDRGTTTLSYDPSGNVIKSVDARGSTGTIYAGYDGLNRPQWQNSTNSPIGAWASYSYDSTANNNQGIGRLTSESFTGSGGMKGSYSYTYDARGQQVNQGVTVNGTNYTLQASYNDAGQMLSETYPTGEIVSQNYSSTGWMLGLATTVKGTTTTLASNIAYNGLAGAAGSVTGMNLGGSLYTYAASYDTGLRLTSASLINASTNALLYQTQPTYDAANNVVGVQTAVSGQTDTQQFCYDAFNRLTWSGTNGTPPCAGTGITSGTLTAAKYQQSDSYDVDGRLTSGPQGTYTYGNTSQPHTLTATSTGYSASYDATGNMTCRALTNATTCSGSSPTGQQLSYNAAGQLASWQNKVTSPTSTVNYLYDGSGQRVAMQSTVNGTVTTTAYIGNIEEVQTTGSATQTTTYYTLGGKRVAAAVNGTFYYFGYDALGSQVAVLNASGSVIGSQLYSPYGSSRYSNGTLPTSIGFTGQRADSVTGLDYYNARYYDPVVGRFVSADMVQGNGQGMDPYAYVGGNPETRTDPTGKRFCVDCGEDGNFSYGNGPATPYQVQTGPSFQVPPDPAPIPTRTTQTTTQTATPTATPTHKPVSIQSGNCQSSAVYCEFPAQNRGDSYLRDYGLSSTDSIEVVGMQGLTDLIERILVKLRDSLLAQIHDDRANGSSPLGGLVMAFGGLLADPTSVPFSVLAFIITSAGAATTISDNQSAASGQFDTEVGVETWYNGITREIQQIQDNLPADDNTHFLLSEYDTYATQQVADPSANWGMPPGVIVSNDEPAYNSIATASFSITRFPS